MAAEFCLRALLVLLIQEVVLRILLPLKIHRPRPGLNPRTLGPVASTLTTSPPRTTVPILQRSNAQSAPTKPGSHDGGL
jgi:hypothetical protein